MSERISISRHEPPMGTEAVSALGLAAFAAVLHVAVLAGRVPGRASPHRAVSHVRWQMPVSRSQDSPCGRTHVASNPHRSYRAGRLALTRGMAVIALATQLNVIRTNGALGR